MTDIPAITRIYAHAVKTGTASFELEPPDEAEMRKRMQALIDGKFPYFVAEIDGAIAGYAYASLYRTRPAYRFTVEDSVYIAPQMQRRGIGKALLVKLIEACNRARLPADDRGDRRFGTGRVDRRAQGMRLCRRRQSEKYRLEIRPLARHADDAARLGTGSDQTATRRTPAQRRRAGCEPALKVSR